MLAINVDGRIELIKEGYIKNLRNINKINYLVYLCPRDGLIEKILENKYLVFESLFKYNKNEESLFSTIIIGYNQYKNFKTIVENENFDESYLFIPNREGISPIHEIFRYGDKELINYFVERYKNEKYYNYLDYNKKLFILFI